MINKINKISVKEKEQLRKDIVKLGYNEHCEIFNIIRLYTDKISENNNGIFINLKYLKDDTIRKVQEFVKYCQKNTIKKTNISSNEINNKIKSDEINNDEIDEIKSDEINSDEIDEINSDDKNLNQSLYNDDTNENLFEGYTSYCLNSNMTNNADKFIFKNYMDKLTVNSRKQFDKNNLVSINKHIKSNKKNGPNIKTTRLKLAGVKARIMKKCRLINRHSYNSKVKVHNKNSYNNINKTYNLSIIDNNKKSLLTQLSEDYNYIN